MKRKLSKRQRQFMAYLTLVGYLESMGTPTSTHAQRRFTAWYMETGNLARRLNERNLDADIEDSSALERECVIILGDARVRRLRKHPKSRYQERQEQHQQRKRHSLPLDLQIRLKRELQIPEPELR